MNRIRGLVLVAGAAFVLPALVTTICVKIAWDVLGGVGLESGDLTTLGIGGLGAALVLGISGRALWRERAATGWRVFGGVVAVAAVVGIGFGLVFGAHIAEEHVAYVRGAATETCAAFVLVHPTLAVDCEARAIRCRTEVRAAPPVVPRGLHPGDAPGASREPSDPVERAVWACLER